MNKIKILLYSHDIDYGGTWRSHENIIKHLDKDIFESYVMYWDKNESNNRLPVSKEILKDTIFVPFERTYERKKDHYAPDATNFTKIARDIGLDIIHFARSGYSEWPFDRRLAKLQVETNIFGDSDPTGFLDKSICISNYVSNIRGRSDAVIYNPVPGEMDVEGLREDLGIAEDAIVLGRIGRYDNPHYIAIKSFEKILKDHANTYYIIICGHHLIKEYVLKNKIPNVIFIEETNDDTYIGRFYKTIDIFAHYRSDGETHGIAIAQAMMNGVPVISHESVVHNGHIETIGDSGRVVGCEDESGYVRFIKEMIEDETYRIKLGDMAKKLAEERYGEKDICKKYQDCYLEWLK